MVSSINRRQVSEDNRSPVHPAPLGYRGVGSRLLALVAALWICLSSLAWAQEASGPTGLDQAQAVRLDPATEVLAYISCREGWRPIDAGSLVKGQEFQHAGRLCRIGADGAVEADADVDLALLSESDRIYESGRARSPLPGDVVRFVDADFRHSRHDRVESAGVGDRFFFQGRLYEVEQGADGPLREAWRDTGIVLSRVTRTFRSDTDALVDLTVVDGSGRESVISGTPEHPFFVPAVNDYVPMSALESGTVLKTLDGAVVTVKSAAVRREDTTVYNFEVEGTHNYCISSPSMNNAVLVHNSCLKVPDANQLAKKLNVPRAKLEALKREIIKDAKNRGLLDKFPAGNPDIGYTKDGFLGFRTPKLYSGKATEIVTGIPIDDWIQKR